MSFIVILIIFIISHFMLLFKSFRFIWCWIISAKYIYEFQCIYIIFIFYFLSTDIIENSVYKNSSSVYKMYASQQFRQTACCHYLWLIVSHKYQGYYNSLFYLFHSIIIKYFVSSHITQFILFTYVNNMMSPITMQCISCQSFIVFHGCQ